MRAAARTPIASLSTFVVAAALLVPAAVSFAQSEPKIAFLNPSSFSQAGARGYIVSNTATNAGPGCCDESDGLFRFSAWVANAPAGSSVFFSIVQGALDYEVVATNASSTAGPSDTWDAEWDMPPEVLNGPATVHAYLVKDNEAIAQASVQVTIVRVEEAIDLVYPRNGGPLGTFSPLATSLPETGRAERRKPVATLDALYTASADATYVRAFYTTSAPGTDPEWKVCGTDTIGSSSNSTPDNGVRCTFDSAAEVPATTAVAAVVNSSPDSFDARFNQSGDAVRAVTYAQQPTLVSLNTLATQTVTKNSRTDRFYCTDPITASVTDQAGRPVPGVNLDVEAAGPSDGLRFHSSTLFASPVAPDRGHSEENGFDCTGSSQAGGVPPTNPNPGVQGEHPLFGSPDVKHVESAPAGADDRGAFSFRLYSNAPGVTDYTVWADEVDDGCGANDDRYTTGEAAASGTIGWGSPSETVTPRAPQSVLACGGGTPTPPPTEPPGPAARSLTLRASDTTVEAGETVRLSGRIRSTSECATGQIVTLKARKPGRRFRAVATARSKTDARYAFRISANATRDYRATVAAAGDCARARSRTLRVTVS